MNRWRVIWLRFFWRRSDRNKGVGCILCGHYHDASMFLSEWQQLDLQLGCCSEPRWERRCGSYRVWLKQGALTGHPGTPARGTHGHHWCHVYLSYERWRSFAVLSSHPPTFTCRSLSLRSASLEAALVTRGRVIPMTRGGASHHTRPPLSRCVVVHPRFPHPVIPHFPRSRRVVVHHLRLRRATTRSRLGVELARRPWLTVRVLRCGPRTASAARETVTVVAGGVTHVRRVGPAGSANHQGQLSMVHFGLGAAAVVELVSVRWSDGSSSKARRRVAAGTMLTMGR